jgi:threonine/homoserine/homoserine lactone efflux protein
MSFLQMLPLAFVMIAGPQIITSFFLATSERFAANSGAYVTGAALAVTAQVTIAYFVAKGATSAASKHTAHKDLDWVLLVLLLGAIVHVYLTRKQSETPKWMSKLQQEQPKYAFMLGLLILGLGPTDILTSLTVGVNVARHDDSWWQCLPFVALTLLFLGSPAIAVVLLGHRANTVLPQVRDWMSQNSWVVSEVVLAIFAALTINSLAS